MSELQCAKTNSTEGNFLLLGKKKNTLSPLQSSPSYLSNSLKQMGLHCGFVFLLFSFFVTLTQSCLGRTSIEKMSHYRLSVGIFIINVGVYTFDPSFGRERQAEPSEFEASLVYTVLLVRVFIGMTETEHTSLRSITS